MLELVAAGMTTIDIIIIYSFLHIRKGRLLLAIWTAILNIVFPLIGFWAGETTAVLFSTWSRLLSGVLLALIGLHMLLQEDGELQAEAKVLSPLLIALAVSLDTLSVSVSFGMLQLNRILFITSSGMFALIFSYAALVGRKRRRSKKGQFIKKVAGVAFIIMGILSWLQ